MKKTIKDVAEACGVSVSLVSRIMNGDPTLKCRPETKAKVLKEVEKQAYTPDYNAKRLANHSAKSQKDIRIGYLSYKGAELRMNVYFDRIAEGVTAVLAMGDYQVERFYVDEVIDLYKRKKPLTDKPLDGLILFGDLPGYLFDYLSRYTKYFSSIYGSVIDNADFVGVDLGSSMNVMLDYIKSLGYTEIGVVFGGDRQRDERLVSYLGEIGVAMNGDFCFNGGYKYKQSFTEMKRRLTDKKPPRLVCCMNDEMAFGVMDALLEEGYSVPDDVSVTGHDDILKSKYSKVPLTTVRIYKEEIGRLITDLLLDRINFKRKFPVKVYTPTELVVRRSTKKIN